MKMHLIKACKNAPLQVKNELSEKKLPILTAETRNIHTGNFLGILLNFGKLNFFNMQIAC